MQNKPILHNCSDPMHLLYMRKSPALYDIDTMHFNWKLQAVSCLQLVKMLIATEGPKLENTKCSAFISFNVICRACTEICSRHKRLNFIYINADCT